MIRVVKNIRVFFCVLFLMTGVFFAGEARAVPPVVNPLSIISYTETSITIAQPAISTIPAPVSFEAYIGLNGTIAVDGTGTGVTGELQGPVNVIASGTTFSGLAADTDYMIIVICINGDGNGNANITQTTSQVPVLDALSVSGYTYTSTSININQPTFSTPSVPALGSTVVAYIGPTTMAVDGAGVVTGSTSNFDVSGGGHTFGGLTPNTNYRIIVVARNGNIPANEFDTVQIDQLTSQVPVLDALSVSGYTYTSTSININQPTFSTPSVPALGSTVVAYIGPTTMAVDGAGVVTGSTSNFDVSGGGHTFGGLTPNTNYRIIVVARNGNIPANEFDTVQIDQLTSQVPVLDVLSIVTFNRLTIEIAQPTFLTSGLPAPVTVNAYIGLNGTIAVDGFGNVTGELFGPIDVSGGGHTFAGLAEDTEYRIIVVAKNNNLPANEFDVAQINQRTSFMNVAIIADPGTITVDGSQYYIPVHSYNITLTVTNNEDNWAAIDPIVINFGPKFFTINNPDGNPDTGLVAPSDPGESASYSIAGTHDNFVLTLVYSLTDVAVGSAADIPGAARTINASVAGTRYGPKNSNTINSNFGIATDGILTANIAVTTGADSTPYGNLGRQYFYHGNNYVFTVTGTANGHSWACVNNITVQIPRTALLADDLVFTYNPAGGLAGNIVSGTETLNYVYTVDDYNAFTISFTWNPSNDVPVAAYAAGRNISVSISSAIVGGPETDAVLHDYGICRRYSIVPEIQAGSGGGVDAPYFRNIYTSGTRFRLQVQNNPAGIPIDFTQANDIEISYNYGVIARTTNFPFPISDPPAPLINSDWIEIQNPSSTEVSSGNTVPFGAYNITEISSGAWNCVLTALPFSNYVSAVYTSPSILWDHADPPGTNVGMFTPWDSTTSTVDTITLNWTPPGADPTFHSYRIYYKPATAEAWSMIDANTNSPETDSLGDISIGTYTITDLQSITEYQYYLTAVDSFGNETLAANRAHGGAVGALFHTVTTAAYALEVQITDGIKLYEHSAMITDNTNPNIRPLLDSAIRFEVNIEGADQPGGMNIIIANVTAAGFDADSNDVFDLHPDLENENPGDKDLANAANGFFRIPVAKISKNKWAGHISSEHPLIVPGTGCKFVLEVIQGSTPSYYGFDPDQNMNITQWTFSVIDSPKVTPWPTRILNNVITSKDPVAYPAYYLTDDAYVTITAYDIKGRVVATLLDNAFRKNGQNIREQGWRGTNKSGRKLGIGLYYIHIKAKRVSDGKTIINKFEKVVMAR